MAQRPEALDPNDEPDLREVLRPVWRWRWLILLLLVVVGGGTYVFYDRQDRVYESSANIFVGPSDALAAVRGTTFTSDRTIVNTATLLRTPELADRVAERIDFERPSALLLPQFNASPVTGSDFITVTGRGGTGADAAELTNAVAQEFVALRSDQERQSIQRSLNGNLVQLRRVPPGVAAAATRASLQATVDQLRLALSLPAGGAQLVDEAAEPGSPVTPRPVRNTLFALALALLVGVGLAFGIERFDRRLRSPEDIRDAFSEPLLAMIPHSSQVAATGERGNVVPDALEEPFRSLLTNVQLMALDQPLRKVVVTSAVPGEGKSTIARNLAIVLREYGLNVALVDADLRRPVQARLLGVKDHPDRGLSTVLTGQTTLEDALIDVPVSVDDLDTLKRLREQTGHAPGPWAAGAADSEGEAIGGLRVLSAGPVPANPQAVLASDRTREIIDELATISDVVVVDSPPLLAVSDSVPLIAQADALVIVARVGIATRDSTRRLHEILARIPGSRWNGVVANDVRADGPIGTYGYSYNYAYTTRGLGKRKRMLRRKLSEPDLEPVAVDTTPMTNGSVDAARESEPAATADR